MSRVSECSETSINSEKPTMESIEENTSENQGLTSAKLEHSQDSSQIFGETDENLPIETDNDNKISAHRNLAEEIIDLKRQEEIIDAYSEQISYIMLDIAFKNLQTERKEIELSYQIDEGFEEFRVPEFDPSQYSYRLGIHASLIKTYFKDLEKKGALRDCFVLLTVNRL